MKNLKKSKNLVSSWSFVLEKNPGFVTWAFLILFITVVYYLLENLTKYGIQANIHQWLYMIIAHPANTINDISAALAAHSIVPVLCCFIIEKALAVEVVPKTLGLIMHFTNLLLLILVPMVAYHYKENFSCIAAALMMHYFSILFLKLLSFVQLNLWHRSSRKFNSQLFKQHTCCLAVNNNKYSKVPNNQESLLHYPNNLNIIAYFYFLFIPTLCYQLSFPRTKKINKMLVLRCIFEVGICFCFCLYIVQQHTLPSIANSFIALNNMDVTRVLELLLDMAILHHLNWICFFYLYFHAWFNLLSEIFRFENRNFYEDWWNAPNVDEFWRKWNLPTHKWAIRHLYIPLIDMGFDKSTAKTTVLFVSAFFHEYMVSVPLSTYGIWAFMAMLMQIPLSHFSRFLAENHDSRLGNILMWCSLIIGHPLCFIIYYRDYVLVHNDRYLMERYGSV